MTPQIKIMRSTFTLPLVVMLVVVTGSFSGDVMSQIARFAARDPGVRPGPAGAGGMLSGLTTLEQQVFGNGREQFQEAQSVQARFRRRNWVLDHASISTVAPAVTRNRTWEEPVQSSTPR